ncbi:MAG: hypothetical protein K6E19_06530 [Lachnospiraceae bacterium]|nr:hypothetical protein [Lachnospiraceae bacterium]
MRTKIIVSLVSKSRGSVNTMIFYFEDEEGNQYTFEAPLDTKGNHKSGMGRLLNLTSHERFVISTELIAKGEKRFKLYQPRIIKEIE